MAYDDTPPVNLGAFARANGISGGASVDDVEIIHRALRRAQGKIFDGQQGFCITSALTRLAQDAGIDIKNITG